SFGYVLDVHDLLLGKGEDVFFLIVFLGCFGEAMALFCTLQISMESLPGLPALDDLVDVHGFTSLAWGRLCSF
ncbi:hypothetical protein Dimus_024092, partial [Dionaea muscipula]